jgi:4a-hydroxytetrahydrobiopterin dehydratase
VADDVNQVELDGALANRLKDWRINGKALQRTFVFKSFAEAIRFVDRLAIHADEMNHHPDMDIRYNKVTVSCMSHDKGRITRRDLTLAGFADEAAEVVDSESDAA